MNTLLRANSISVAFGGIRAVDDVSVTVEAGQIVGLIGPNGAGKTTFVDAITGFLPRATGTVEYLGRDITRTAAHKRVGMGLVRTWQAGEMFDDLSIMDNLRVAQDWQPQDSSISPEGLCSRIGLDVPLDQLPSNVSFGHRKLLGFARALASGPTMMCLDEPAAGLGVAESQILKQLIDEERRNGVGVLLIDHDMNFVMSICDYVYVLQFGRIIDEGTPAQVRSSRVVVDAYLGTRA